MFGGDDGNWSKEETNLNEVGALTYMASSTLNDHRHRGARDGLMSVF